MIREIVPRKQSSEPLSLREPMDKENKVITGNLQGSEGTAPKIVSFPKEYLTLGYEPVELRPLLHDIVLKVLPIIRERKVRFSFDVAGGLPQVRGNSSDLRRAFTDIIRNALDSIPPGGQFSISVSYFAADGLPERVEVRVEVTGLGIQGENQKKAFESDPSTKLTMIGTGLTEARTAVISSGGSICVETQPGAGSALTVSLLVHRQE